jgi:hypothetical protein
VACQVIANQIDPTEAAYSQFSFHGEVFQNLFSRLPERKFNDGLILSGLTEKLTLVLSCLDSGQQATDSFRILRIALYKIVKVQ